MENFKRGSEWRKWDLHIHTIESKLNNQFGSDWDKYIYNLFSKAIKNGVHAIGITDYFSIDGYKTVIKYQKDKEKLRKIFKKEIEKDINYIYKIEQILLLPNIEFRVDTFITNEDGEDKKLQVHVIFDNTLDIEDIEQNFLSRLEVVSDSSIDGIDKSSLTKFNIENLGKKLKKEQLDGFGTLGDYEAGCKAVSVNFDRIKEVLLNTKFKNRYILLLAQDDITKISWRSQAHNEKKKFYSSCHGIMSANKSTINWGVQEDTREEFSSYKPCFWGSDAHSFNEMFKPKLDRFCWIKADLTFEGLRQVLISPKERVFIGNVCEQLDNCTQNASCIIDNIEVKKIEDYKHDVTWFDFNIPLNPNMVTIIGNKGSGKSALSDIISLTARSKKMEYASFINKDRFKKLPEKYAEDYEAEIIWRDRQKSAKINLYTDVDDKEVELVQFLPQNYIENVCNGLNDLFQQEIEDVIFSYIDNKNKENSNNLSELINIKTALLNSKFQKVRNELEDINLKIALLENKSTQKYKDSIEEKLNSQKLKYERHMALKPKKVNKPKNIENNKHTRLISTIDKQIDKNQEILNKYETELIDVNTQLTKINNFNVNVDLLKEQIESTNKEYLQLLIDLDFNTENVKDYITYKNNSTILRNYKIKLLDKKKKLEDLTATINIDLGNMEPIDNIPLSIKQINEKINKESSIEYKLYILNEIKAKIIDKTSIENQKYQKYLEDLKDWEEKRKLISGEKIGSSEGSIKQYEEEKEYLDKQLDLELNKFYRKRIQIISKIYDLHEENCNILTKIYKPVEEKLKSILKNMDEKISFDVQIIADKELKDEIILKIDQRISSDFQGKTEGVAKLNDMILSTKFNEKESTMKFISDIYEIVNKNKDNIKSLLKNKEVEFYNYIGNINFLKSKYTLKLGNKSLKSLSPGERGIVLLIFYLALNKSNIPLIIDQPEDNLDNQSVFDKLVPCIKEAKKHRQVIIVTHNPNIAIACDSEQIIYCKINKETDFIEYTSGSIENKVIREKVIDVLEGTMPAFDLRKLKYSSSLD